MRYLGIDYGSRRVGVAISDEGGVFAFPRETMRVSSIDGAVRCIKNIVQEEKVDTIIIGLPVSFAGGESEQARTVRSFAALLSNAVQLPIEFQNEILSSKVATREGIGDERIDAAAAALILQAYLDSRS